MNHTHVKASRPSTGCPRPAKRWAAPSNARSVIEVMRIMSPSVSHVQSAMRYVGRKEQRERKIITGTWGVER